MPSITSPPDPTGARNDFLTTTNHGRTKTRKSKLERRMIMNRPTSITGVFSALILMLCIQASDAGSAIWDHNPGSSDWNTATNWTPATVPNGPSDTAFFDLSNTTALSIASSQIRLPGRWIECVNRGCKISATLSPAASPSVNGAAAVRSSITPWR